MKSGVEDEDPQMAADWLLPFCFLGWRLICDSYCRACQTRNDKRESTEAYFGACDLCCLGFIYCMSFARRALSLSCSSGSKTDALRFNEMGTVGVDTLRILFAIRVKCGSGSRHKGGAVAICAERQHGSKNS
jgi:hypothetical protein